MEDTALEFFENIEIPPAKQLQDQHIANIMWAFASASVRRLDVFETLASEVLARDSFTLQAVSNIAWAFTTLCIRHETLMDHLLGIASRHLSSKQCATQEHVPFWLGLLWAAGPQSAAEEALRSLGAQRDEQVPANGLLLPGCTGDLWIKPHIAMETCSAVVVFKPPDWEVDSDQLEVAAGAQRLSSFLGEYAHQASVVCSRIHSHGFVSRLDTPSSGLVLQATNYRGFYDLAIQRELGLLRREYLVLCHGWFPGERTITARIQKRRGSASKVSLHGRPAKTHAKAIGTMITQLDG